jgi:hypothetical protein
MDAWLRTDAVSKGVSFRFRLVHSPVQATPMTQSAAREAMHGAKREYPEYAWGMEVGFNNDEFLVHGQRQSEGPIRSRAEAG